MKERKKEREREREREKKRESGLGRKVRGPSPVHSSRIIAIHKALRLRERFLLSRIGQSHPLRPESSANCLW